MPINTSPSKELPSKKDEGIKKNSFKLSEPKYIFSDLILPSNTKNDLMHAIGLSNYQKEIYDEWGFKSTHKHNKKIIINLYGESGTGKTMSAHAIADKLNKKILIVNYADIESKYVGETPKNISAAFDFAKENDAIIFFDEADAILSRRVTNMSSSTDTSVNQTRSVMLNLLNDYDDIVIFATNFISNYDPAFMRRIIINIYFSLPNKDTRRALFKHYIPDQLPHNIDIEDAIEQSEFLSGSDIANSIILAAFSAKVDGKQKVEHQDLINKIKAIKLCKQENNPDYAKTTKIVSEEYTLAQLGKKGEKI